jgi:hypothetical protein
MKFRLILVAAFVVFSSACTEKHYVETTNDTVSFYYSDSDAKEILFASSIDNYQYHAATRLNSSLWKVSASARKGFGYFYIVDGVVTLPDCRYTEYDDFGSKNCLYILGM